MISVGLDVSCKSTGVVVLEAKERVKSPTVLEAFAIQPKKLVGVERNKAICSTIMEVLDRHKPGIVAVEGYSLGRNLNAAIALCELGGLLRFCFHLDGYPWLDPRAGQVKKFVTGNGGSPKDQMTMFVFKNWGFQAANNDIADGFGVAVMGLAYRGMLLGMTKQQVEVTGEMKLISN